MSAAFALVGTSLSLVAPPSPVVVFGPGSLDVRLTIAKLAAREGFGTTLITGDGAQQQWRRIMYGPDYAEAGRDDPECAQLASGSDQIRAALAGAQALACVCDEAPLPESSLESALAEAPQLQRGVLLSKMGVTRAKPAGPFGLGGGAAALLEGEERIRAATLARGLELSIVRVGTLK